MENSSEELFNFMSDSGKLGSFRKYLISFLLRVEEFMADVGTPDAHDFEETHKLIQNIEFQLHQLTRYQQNADKMLLDMRKEDRRMLYREAPWVLELFGWHAKINEAGDIVGKK